MFSAINNNKYNVLNMKPITQIQLAAAYSSLINCLKDKCSLVHDSLFFPLLLYLGKKIFFFVMNQISKS